MFRRTLFFMGVIANLGSLLGVIAMVSLFPTLTIPGNSIDNFILTYCLATGLQGITMGLGGRKLRIIAIIIAVALGIFLGKNAGAFHNPLFFLPLAIYLASLWVGSIMGSPFQQGKKKRVPRTPEKPKRR
jgi:hypothetical protein